MIEITINGHPQDMQNLSYVCVGFMVVASLAVIYSVYRWIKDR